MKPVHTEPVLHNKRSHRNENAHTAARDSPPPPATRESPLTITKTQRSKKQIKSFFKKRNSIQFQFFFLREQIQCGLRFVFPCYMERCPHTGLRWKCPHPARRHTGCCGGGKKRTGDFPGGLVAKISHSQCKGPGFNPWSGN